MNKELSRIVDAYLMLLSESTDYQQDPEVRTIMQEAQTVLARYWKRMQQSSKRYVVAVVGLTHVGESTLLNGLLEGNLTPVRSGPCASAPIEFEYGEELLVTAHERVSRQKYHCDSYDDIRKQLEELAAPSGQMKKIVVASPQPLLKQGLIIAEIPGFGAAKGVQDESLKYYLKDEVAQVFWVVSATKTIGSTEKNIYDKFFSQICDDLVVTGCEEHDADERSSFRKRFSSMLFQSIKFHFISAKDGSRAIEKGDLAALEASGITALKERIQDIASPDGRAMALFDNMQRLSEDLSAALNDYLRANSKSVRMIWREDSWFRWMSVLPESVLKQTLNRALKEAGSQ